MAFKLMGVSRLVTLFDGYSGEISETMSERPGPQNSRVVRTRLLIPGKRTVGISYITVRTGKRWAIVDALLDNNISELTVRRSEYRSVLKNEGVEGLISVLNKKAKELLAK
jgi:ABC-type transporter MlaC component